MESLLWMSVDELLENFTDDAIAYLYVTKISTTSL